LDYIQVDDESIATMGPVTVKNTSAEANITVQLPIKIQELIKAVQKGAKRKSPGPDQDPGFLLV